MELWNDLDDGTVSVDTITPKLGKLGFLFFEVNFAVVFSTDTSELL